MTAHRGRPTLGLEEELHVVDRGTGRLVSEAPRILAALTGQDTPSPVDGQVVQELTLSQVETVTSVSAGLGTLLVRAWRLRTAAAGVAAGQGLRLLASGTPVLGSAAEQQVAQDERYLPITSRVGSLVDDQLIAGMHLHVGPSGDVGADEADDDLRVAVLDGLRAWLPPLLALTANSPYWLGRDTGFASYRQVHWQRWPAIGAPPRTRDVRGYDRAVDELVAAGVVADPSYVYWDARLARRFPTVEVRVADVVPTLEEAATFAALVRGLAVRAALDALSLREPLDPSPHALRAALWQAARHGLSGRLVDPPTGDLARAADVVRAMLEHARPGLEVTGDHEVASEGLARVLADGNGAQRQRAAYARGGWAEVVREVTVDPEATRPALPLGPSLAGRPVTHGDGNGWVQCSCGQRHWGRHGAAGLLAVRPGDSGPEVLLQLRAGWTHQGGTWGVPGGARDSHESLHEAAVREAHEEAALDPTAVSAVEEVVLVDHGDWSFGYALVTAAAGTSAGVANLESDAIAWVALDEVPGLPLLPAFAEAWDELRVRIDALLERA